jgi:hypothetical protein
VPFFTESQPKKKHRLQGDKKTPASDGKALCAKSPKKRVNDEF